MLIDFEQTLNPIQRIHQYLSCELAELHDLISSCFAQQEQLICSLAEHFISSNGKKLRPLLTILCSKMLRYTGNAHMSFAAAVELIHIATLLHDDVIDNSVLRRSAPTANFLWGNKASILGGDFFFSQSFKLMVRGGCLKSLELLSGASAEIVSGEIKQLVYLQSRRFISVHEYFDIIASKTAKLFSAACQVAGLLHQSNDHDLHDNLRNFGLLLGIMYQIKDDAMDYFSTQTGKERGADFKEGKITLPIILLYNICSQNDKARLEELFLHKAARDNSDLLCALEMLEFYEIKKQIESQITTLALQATNHLDSIVGEQMPKQKLLEIISFISDID